MVGQILRFETKYAMLRDEIMSGRLGSAVSMHARRNRPKSLLPRYGRTHPALKNCIHDVDLMLWYTRRLVKRVRGYARHATGRQHPDTFWGFLEFAGDAVGVVETIWMLPDAGVMLEQSLRQRLRESGFLTSIDAARGMVQVRIVQYKLLTGFDRREAGTIQSRSHQKGTVSERRASSMIQGGRGRRQSKTDPSLELLSKPGCKHGSRFRAHTSGDAVVSRRRRR